MTFSGYNVEQRSKEVKALQSFLIYSLIGSMAMHIGLLASGWGNFLARVPENEQEPIEIAIVDPVTAEVEKPPEEVLAEPKTDNSSGGGSQGGGSSSEIAIATKPQIINQTRPVPKVVNNFKTPQVQQQPQKTITPIEKAQPVNKLSQELATEPQAPTKSAIVNPSTNQSSDNLRRLLGGLRNSQKTQGNVGGGTSSSLTPGSGTGNGTGNGSGNGTGNGIGNGTGNGSGNGSGNSQAIATAPTPPKIPTEPRENNRSGNGRAACRECNARYPEAARRRGIEGRVEVAIDTDAQGNVTNVRVARSSGNRELDEETLRQARNWKLKPAQGGRQGVAIATEFALQGTRRHRQVQEQKKRREAEARSRETTAANTDSSTQTTPTRRRRLPISTDANIPTQNTSETRVRRRQESTAATRRQPVESTNTNSSARESLRRIRRERTTNNPTQEAPQKTITRRRRENGNSASQNKLRATLRNLRQPAPSSPAPTTQE